MFRGTLTQTSVYPREVVKRALALNAAAVILAHNHPSGVAEPSRADEYLTQTLKSALALVDVRVLDHLVVGRGQVVSIRRAGAAVKAGREGRRWRPSAAELREALPSAGASAKRGRAERAARGAAARQRARACSAAAVGPVTRCRPRLADLQPARAGTANRAARGRRGPGAARGAVRRGRRRVTAAHRRRPELSAAPGGADVVTRSAPRPLEPAGPDRPARPAPRRGARGAGGTSWPRPPQGRRCVRVVHGKGLGRPGASRCSRPRCSAGWRSAAEVIVAFIPGQRARRAAPAR
jgi:hypothetical protein